MTAVYLDLLVLALALAIDLLFGEPPVRIHPTVLIGKTISAANSVLRRRTQHRERRLPLEWWWRARFPPLGARLPGW